MDNTVGSFPAAGRNNPVTTESAGGRGHRFEDSNYETPTSLMENKNISPEYISGYVDGEGCFTVTFNFRMKAKLRWELRPSFSVSQNEDRRQVLDLMRNYFGCGHIRRDYADKTVKFEVRDHRDLIGKIIPHFERFPLLSKKQQDFELFRAICGKVHGGDHLVSEGFVEIVHLAYAMNGSGKRKHPKEYIINSLLEKKI